VHNAHNALGVAMDYNYDFELLNNMVNDPPRYQIFSLLQDFKADIKESQKAKKEYEFERKLDFNIFTSISDVYKRENLHSDILKQILDPKTPKIGSLENIRLFIQILKKRKPRLNIQLGEKITVEREKKHIDVRVYDENGNCIIIENKINNARDQKDQLGRYFSAIENKKNGLNLKVNAIVYLTLTPNKKPIMNYTVKDAKKRRKIKDLLVHIPVINTRKEISFSSDFITKCQEAADNDVARVYYSEYNRLIKSLGGNEMTRASDCTIVREIYKDKEKLENFKTFSEIWEGLDEIVLAIIEEKLEDGGFMFDEKSDKAMAYKIDDQISIAFWRAGPSIGFILNKKVLKASKDINAVVNMLKEALNAKELVDIFKDGVEVMKREGYIYRDIGIDFFKKGIDNVIFNIEMLKKIVKKN
jgi:hypothetical protein